MVEALYLIMFWRVLSSSLSECSKQIFGRFDAFIDKQTRAVANGMTQTHLGCSGNLITLLIGMYLRQINK